jgi:hypothetical protein
MNNNTNEPGVGDQEMKLYPTDWHLKKEVSYGHIISTLLLAILLIGGWVNTQNRIAVLEQHPDLGAHRISEERLDSLEVSVSRIEAVNLSMQKEILRRLDRQDVKLDRIEDRLNSDG